MSGEHVPAENRRGGRIAGSATRMTRKKADELAGSGRAPLDVMLANMGFWWDRAERLGEKLGAVLDAAPLSQMSDEERAEFRKLANMFLSARERAQGCAVDAAPYVHPKLQSIVLKKQVTRTTITMALPPPAAGEDRSYRDNPVAGPEDNVVKLVERHRG